MKAMRISAIVILGLTLGWVYVPAQEPTVILSVAEIARQVQSRNLDIFKAAQSVERARKELAGEAELMESSLSVGGGYTTTRSGANGWYGQSSLTLPFLPQLSAGATLGVDEQWRFEESLSLTVKPLTPSDQTYSEEQAYNSARVSERYLKRRLFLDAEGAALSLLIRDMERELARDAEKLEEKKYELVQRRQEVGDASFQDVQDQLVDLIEARQDLFDSQKRYLTGWRNLQLLFAPGEERIAVQPLPLVELLDWIEVRKSEANRFDNKKPVTEKMEYLGLELTALQTELKITPAWRPDLSLSAAVAFPYEFPQSHSVSLNFTISPDQLQKEERRELQEDIELARLEIAAETYATQLQKTLARQSIDLAEQALKGGRIQEERDQLVLQEAELLFQQGRRTTLELEQLRLNLRRTEILSFQAAAELYRVLGEYLLLFLGQ